MNASAARKPGFVLKGWHVLLMLVGFFFFMFVVNGIFLWAAITSFPGEDEQKSYMQGLHYNETIEARKVREAEGWTAQVGLAGAGAEQSLVIRLFDNSGAPLAAESVSAQIRRTATEMRDEDLVLERIGAGEYAASVGHLERGLWEARIEAQIPLSEGNSAFIVKKNLIVE